MNILRKLTIRTMKKNPKRTLVTVVGIILATALITAVANLAASFQNSVVVYEKEEKGDFHYRFTGVKAEKLKYFQNNVNIKKLSAAEEIGYADFSESKNPDKPYLYILSMDEACRDTVSLRLASGRWPENESEIVIASHMRSNGGSRLTTGDKVTLTMGLRNTEDGYVWQDTPYLGEGESFVPTGQKEYTVVGIMQRPSFNLESYIASGYTAVTLVSESITGVSDVPDKEAEPHTERRMTVYASYTAKGLKHRQEVTEGLLAFADGHESNSTLIRWETIHLINLDNTAERMIYSMGGIALAIIIVSSVFCIRNSFQISLTEKLRLYGMLSSVGTTSKQRKKLVFGEAFYLGLIGIPLGIASGVLATYVLVTICSEMMRYAMEVKLYYVFSWPAVIVGAALAAVTIYLSAAKSARKAAKISPISAIRANETIRRGRRELRVPWAIRGLFGVGGTLAYKNLRRSRVKYRTTVISIVVSVTVFIAMTTFVHLGFRATGTQYETATYPIVVTLQDAEQKEQAAAICSMEEAQKSMTLRRTAPFLISSDQVRCTPESLAVGELGWDFGMTSETRNDGFRLWVYALGERAYEEYCRKVGAPTAEAEQGAIIYAEYCVGMDDGKGMKYYEGRIADFEKGSTLEAWCHDPANGDPGMPGSEEGGTAEKTLSVPVVCQTKVKPDFVRGRDNSRIICVVSDAWMDEKLADQIYPQTDVYIQCEDADAMESRIRSEVPLYSFYITNNQRMAKEQQSFWLLMAIFFYGFIAVIALIGVTNIFNTVTTNMELRSREFAMLRSVGMTGREFRRMVRLESVFYGGGALCIGIPLGCLLSKLFYLALDLKMEVPYEWPLSGIGIASAAVALLLFAIMRYSMGKIQKKNVIETIQNENI